MKQLRVEFAVGVVLVSLVFAAFGPALSNPFVEIDDSTYITQNPRVLRGLSWEGTRWAFTTFHGSNWHPLTWLSLQADVTLFGSGPWGVHFTNLLLHAAAAVVLFAALRMMTGSVWRSAFVAAFFAVHPLRVESVAWAAERKDVLSGLFWMLALLGFAWYARRPSVGRYLLVFVVFALGLLAKPMLVTLPCVLLLLDWWPLQRLAGKASAQASARRVGWLVAEKVPLLALAAASCAVTVWAQQQAASSLAVVAVGPRLANALVSYAAYLGKTVWPVNLALLYPFPIAGVPVAQAVGAVLLLAVITWLGIRFRKTQPALLMGWLWYLGTLVPVLGLVQVGAQAMADRYTYIPSVGIAIAVVWTIAGLAAQRHHEMRWAAATAGLLLGAVVLSWGQTQKWRDDVVLWEHTLAVTGADNPFAQNALGLALNSCGRKQEAVEHFNRGLQSSPHHPELHGNLGAVLLKLGDKAGAFDHLTQAVAAMPGNPLMQHDLGVAYYLLGRVPEAAEHFRKALEINPDFAQAYYRLGQCARRQGNWGEAVAALRKAAALAPDATLHHCALAYVLNRRGDGSEAAAEYREASRLSPNWQREQMQAAWYLSTRPNPRDCNPMEAIDMAEQVCDAAGWKNADQLDTLAVAYGAAGRYHDAVTTARKALAAVSGTPGKPGLAETLRDHLAQFERLEANSAGNGRPRAP
jgi:tetratricopeptide (TPR) repeat protein